MIAGSLYSGREPDRRRTVVAALKNNTVLMYPVDRPADAGATRQWLNELTNATADIGPTTPSWR